MAEREREKEKEKILRESEKEGDSERGRDREIGDKERSRELGVERWTDKRAWESVQRDTIGGFLVGLSAHRWKTG